jgi:hypothetical protein
MPRIDNIDNDEQTSEPTHGFVELIKTAAGTAKQGIITGLYWAKAWLLLILVGLAIVVGLLEWLGIDTGVPDVAAGYSIYFAGASLIGLPISKMILDWLVERYGEFLHDVDPATGDAAGWQLPPESWEDLTVYTVDVLDDGTEVEREIEKSELHTISTSFGMGWECEQYDPVENRAKISYMGELAPYELRQDKSNIEYIQGRLSTMADAAVDVISNIHQIARDASGREINKNIRVTEGIRLQDEDAVSSSIQSAIQNSALAEHPKLNLGSESVGDERLPGEHTPESYQNNGRGGEEQ